MGVGCLLGVAEKENIPIHFIDEQVENDVLGLVDRYVKQMIKPYIFGFSVLTVALKRHFCFKGTEDFTRTQLLYSGRSSNCDARRNLILRP